jgi:hypothetical protein
MPGLWVVGYITDWYQSFRLKHQTGMGQTVGQGIMVKNEYVLEILNLRRDSIAEIVHKARASCRQRSFVKDRRIVTIPF